MHYKHTTVRLYGTDLCGACKPWHSEAFFTTQCRPASSCGASFADVALIPLFVVSLVLYTLFFWFRGYRVLPCRRVSPTADTQAPISKDHRHIQGLSALGPLDPIRSSKVPGTARRVSMHAFFYFFQTLNLVVIRNGNENDVLSLMVTTFHFSLIELHFGHSNGSGHSGNCAREPQPLFKGCNRVPS